MQLTINGKQLNVADALLGDIEKDLPTVVGKYFENPTDSHANMSKQGKDIRVGGNIGCVDPRGSRGDVPEGN